MKNMGLFVFLVVLNLYGCMVTPTDSARDRSRDFERFTMERSAALNDWWAK